MRGGAASEQFIREHRELAQRAWRRTTGGNHRLQSCPRRVGRVSETIEEERIYFRPERRPLCDRHVHEDGLRRQVKRRFEGQKHA